ncbi:hypothetical protein [Nocardia salmonicida]|uniref:hypothetical protein n=1 Tax=Nocardia salmonicida TaxID=53431 RepID=UPI002E2B6822|nr:hypothetical protein [Nocardia salmonicida]
MFWVFISVLALAGGAVVLLASILPVAPDDLDPNSLLVARRRRVRPLPDLAPLDHSAPEALLTVAQAHRAQQVHVACPPWLCPAKAMAMTILEANHRRSHSKTIL